MGQLKQSGYQITPDAADAETIVVNTCGFIDSAKKESIDTILEAAQLKTNGQAKRLIVAGCLVERYRDELKAEIPEVDAFIGTSQINDILTVCDPKTNTRSLPVVPLGNQSATYLYDESTPRVLATPSHLRVCKDRRRLRSPCAFCFIPQMRGHFRSRRFGSIVAEAHQLAEEGRQRDHSRGPGFFALRRRPRQAGRARATAARTLARRRHRVGARDVHLSDAHQRRVSRRARRRAEGGEVSRHAFAARVAERSETDEARRQSQESGTFDRACGSVCPGSQCGQRSSPAFRVRLKRTSRSCWVHQERGVRSRRCFHLLRRRRHAGFRLA
jgi:hypothetical protein